MKKAFYNRNILITGGTGSWGQVLARKLLEFDPRSISIFSRNENNQWKMKKGFPEFKYFIGDVKSQVTLTRVMKEVDIVFHLAALKHVPICEENPWECVHTNVIGTENVIRAAIDNNVSTVVYVSTDKACNPLNLYGACKSVGEKLIVDANKRSNTKFICIRAGNVIGSSGSVVPIFVELAKTTKQYFITDEAMTRYFMTIEDVLGLVLKAAISGIGGEIFVTKMSAAKIVDIAWAIHTYYNSPGDEFKYDIIGIRSGEKINEKLVSEDESRHTVEDDMFRIILPQDGSLDKYYKKYKKMEEGHYSSDQYLMDKNQIIEILKRSGKI